MAATLAAQQQAAAYMAQQQFSAALALGTLPCLPTPPEGKTISQDTVLSAGRCGRASCMTAVLLRGVNSDVFMASWPSKVLVAMCCSGYACMRGVSKSIAHGMLMRRWRIRQAWCEVRYSCTCWSKRENVVSASERLLWHKCWQAERHRCSDSGGVWQRKAGQA